MSGKRSKWLFLLLPLLVVTTANAAPTMNNRIVCAVSQLSDTRTHLAAQTSQVAESCNSYLGIATEFLKPPVGFTNSMGSPSIHTKALPAVPGAVFMVLIGFICVSLVKDRKAWLAIMAGLLWAGQAGFAAMPQLACHLCSKKQIEQQSAPNITYVCENERCYRLRSDIEDTRYISLLCHLAGIPDSTMLFLQNLSSTLCGGQESRKVTTQLYCQSNLSKNTISFQSQAAFLPKQHSLIPLTICLVSIFEQFICFSPAFVFENLPRGPPESA